jgi:hypothetical protein
MGFKIGLTTSTINISTGIAAIIKLRVPHESQRSALQISLSEFYLQARK